MREWSAEITVDATLARRLIGRQFPQLEVASLRLLAAGWDNTVWLVDGRWTFRFPRRDIAIPGVEDEMAVLPRLAPLLPLPIPEPLFFGRPADGYPWPFLGAPLLRGREASETDLTDAARHRLARPLGAFLRSLHSADVAAAVAEVRALPVDRNRRADMARRVPRTIEFLAEIERLGLWRTPASTAHILEAAAALPAPEPTAVVHGDLHFRHLLLGDDGGPAGVIDWGDVCRADPSVDLQLYWSFLPPEARADFLDEYGEVSEEQLLGARVLALCLCAALAAYAHHEGLQHVEREAVEGLARAAPER